MGTAAAPDRATFLAGRRSGIGSSDAPMLIGVSPWGGPWRVWESKVSPPPAEDTAGEAARWGQKLEALVAKDWAVATGHKIMRRRRQFRSPRWEWAIANPDRWVVGEKSLLEVKVVFHRATDWGDSPEEAPPYVRIQCQHQMAVTGTKRVYVPVFFAGRPESRDYLVERDDALIGHLMTVEEAFWTDHVLTGTPPPPDASDDARSGLARLHAAEDDTTLTATPELTAVIEQLLAATHQAAAAEEAVQGYQNTIKAAMGSASTLLSRVARVTWRRGERDTVDWKAVALWYEPQPDWKQMVADHTTTKPTTLFRVTPSGETDAS